MQNPQRNLHGFNQQLNPQSNQNIHIQNNNNIQANLSPIQIAQLLKQNEQNIKKTILNDVLNDYNSNLQYQNQEQNQNQPQVPFYQNDNFKENVNNNLQNSVNGKLNNEAQQLAQLLNQISNNMQQQPPNFGQESQIQPQQNTQNIQVPKQYRENKEKTPNKKQNNKTTSQITSKQSITTRDSEEDSCSFRPMLSKKSMQIAERLPESSRQRLQQSKQKTKSKLEKIKEQIEKEKYCFTPKINKKRSSTITPQYDNNNQEIFNPINALNQQNQSPHFNGEHQSPFIQTQQFQRPGEQKQPVYDRLYNIGKQYQQKKQEMTMEKFKSEIEADTECTFQPTINSKSQKLISNYSQIQRSEDFLKSKQKKLEELRNQNLMEKEIFEQKNCTHIPQFCKFNQQKLDIQSRPVQKQILAVKGCEQFYERQDKAKRQKQEKSHKLNSISNTKSQPKLYTVPESAQRLFSLSKNPTTTQLGKSSQKKPQQTGRLFDINDVNFNQITEPYNGNFTSNSNNLISTNRKSVKSKSPLKMMEKNYDRTHNKIIHITKDRSISQTPIHSTENNIRDQYSQKQFLQKQVQKMKNSLSVHNNLSPKNDLQGYLQQGQYNNTDHVPNFAQNLCNTNSTSNFNKFEQSSKLQKEKYLVPDFIEEQNLNELIQQNQNQNLNQIDQNILKQQFLLTEELKKQELQSIQENETNYNQNITNNMINNNQNNTNNNEQDESLNMIKTMQQLHKQLMDIQI